MTSFVLYTAQTWVGLIRMFLSPDYLHSNYFTQLFLVWILMWNGNISIYNTCTPLENKKEERKKKKVLWTYVRSSYLFFIWFFHQPPNSEVVNRRHFLVFFFRERKVKILRRPSHTSKHSGKESWYLKTIDKVPFFLVELFCFFFLSLLETTWTHTKKWLR